MSNEDKISLKPFLDTVEQRLDSFTSQELRSILMSMALETPLSARQGFLETLTPPEPESIEAEKTTYQEELLNDIEEFIDELESEMADFDEPDWGDEYYDEEDALGPYAALVPEIEMLLDRTGATFDDGNRQLARDAYKRLFNVFEIEDDYGRRIDSSDIENLDMKQVIARYLRAVYETAPQKRRSQSLFDEMLRVLHMVAGKRIGLVDLLQIATDPLPDQEQFLNEWVVFLQGQDGKAADYWLREAVRLSKGAQGLEELALSEGTKHPRAFLDWIATLMEQEELSAVMAAIEKAREVLSPDMPIRAAIADYLWEAAQQLGDEELAATAKWEAFFAKSQLSRFLDLWESSPDEDKRLGLIQRASERIRTYLAQKRPLSFSHSPFDIDDAETYAYITKSVLAHAYLLSGDWESAYQMARKENELGWSQGDNPQGLVMVCFLGLASGKPPDDFPANLSLLWNTVLENTLDFGDKEAIVLSKLKRIYEEVFSNASLGQKADTLFNWCVNTAKKRANSIVENQYRKSYWKAASLITACAEVLRFRGEEGEAQALISGIRNQFPRHRSFQDELRIANTRQK